MYPSVLLTLAAPAQAIAFSRFSLSRYLLFSHLRLPPSPLSSPSRALRYAHSARVRHTRSPGPCLWLSIAGFAQPRPGQPRSVSPGGRTLLEGSPSCMIASPCAKRWPGSLTFPPASSAQREPTLSTHFALISKARSPGPSLAVVTWSQWRRRTPSSPDRHDHTPSGVTPGPVNLPICGGRGEPRAQLARTRQDAQNLEARRSRN
jgi:hypothetical protein